MLSLFCSVLLCSVGLAAQISGQVGVQTVRTSTAPRIDGVLDDTVWGSAVPVESFYQRNPVEGAPPTERTVLRILHDDEQIYFAIHCFESEPERIIGTQMQRDAELDSDDNVSITLDTYNDRRGGFYFNTNPLGARADQLLTDEGRSRNEAWDCVWSCRTSRNSEGWTVEIAIPFDQLRYAESVNAVWGINVSRTIRRKREDVYLVPPPQAYGFRGMFRTSKLTQLAGLGELQTKPRLQMTPYTLTGTNREFEGLDPTEQPTFNAGIDAKYGLTPGLTLDLSYKTDFAQVEADQEQVNLTRFSLFFPEKRDFFLEGAGIFDFGERRQTVGGGTIRPPTILFYSRRIGIQDGHNLPVVFGGKLTGRAGAFEIGTLHFMTDAKTFIDEKEEERVLTDTGLLLEENDPLVEMSQIVDTVDVAVLDTLDVARTNVSLVRVRRDVFGRSNIGIIAINRSPGEKTDHNRSLGGDLSFSFFNSSLNLRGFYAKTWTPGVEGEDVAGMAELDLKKGKFEFQTSYLDIQKNFNPEVGFVPRDDIRRFKASGRWSPRPNSPRIRRFSIGPRFTYLMDQNNLLQSRDFEFSSFMNLEIGDWIGMRLRNRFERLSKEFDVHEGIKIPTGEYNFTTIGPTMFSNKGRRISGSLSLEIGQFFDGTRKRFSGRSELKVTNQFTIESRYERNRVSLPAGEFLTNQVTNRFLYSFSPDLFVRALVQWNSKRK
ncbi:MAG: DUF5916 domain-containing protein, partial [Candidatus Latescibacterota bacterium]|nr:DUF5916 domain-containing protein [Candidatus Latescibacterota bacterium]